MNTRIQNHLEPSIRDRQLDGWDRRSFLKTTATTAAGALVAPALTGAERDWSGRTPVRYPDPDIVVLDPRFEKYRQFNAAMESRDTNNHNHLVMGPWNHGQWAGGLDPKADALGNLRFGSATGEYFRRRIQAPWFAFWLKGKGDGRFPEATIFDAGANAWLTFDAWPSQQARARRLIQSTERVSIPRTSR